MKYMLLIYSAPGPSTEPECTMEDWEQFGKDMKDAGVWRSGDALADMTSATTVRVANGERTVTDGPFAETREILGGYEVIDVPDLDAALEWAARCPGARDGGSVQVRPLAGYGD